MRKILKSLMIVLMILGIVFSVLNFISLDNVAFNRYDGTQQPDGCYGEPLNCYTGIPPK